MVHGFVAFERDISRFFDPVTWVVQSVRDCFIYNKWFFTDWESFLPFLFVLLIFVVLALHNYHRLYMEVPDVL